MKIISLLFFISLLTIGCNPKKPNKNELKADVKTKEKAAIEKLDLSQIKQIIEGIWLPEKYIAELKKTKSAYLAHRYIPDVAELQIKPDKIKNDTLHIWASLNNHEGYAFKIWFTLQDNSIKINTDAKNWTADSFNYELRYQTNPDTALQLTSINKIDGKELIETIYKRVRNKEHISNSGGLGYDYLAREVMLNGSYELLDSTKSSLGGVNFNPENKKVKGFKYHYYEVLTDFTGPEYGIDCIRFYTKKGDNRNSVNYPTAIKYDTLILFDSRTLGDLTEYNTKPDKIIYYLVKI